MSESMTLNRPLVSADDDDPLFSADHAHDPSGAQQRAETTVGDIEETARRRETVASDIPDVQIIGTVYKMTVQTDSRGAVLVAYTRDADTGQTGRAFIRFDGAGVDYIRRRLTPQSQ